MLSPHLSHTVCPCQKLKIHACGQLTFFPGACSPTAVASFVCVWCVYGIFLVAVFVILILLFEVLRIVREKQA